MDGRDGQSCPCLYSDAAPICRADLKALHVPLRAHLDRFCRRPRYRRCDLYRAWLETLRASPGASSEAIVPPPDGTTLALPVGEPARDEETVRKEDLMITTIFKKLVSDERAQDLAEYGIAMTVIAAGVFLVAAAIRNNVLTLWSAASAIIAAAP